MIKLFQGAAFRQELRLFCYILEVCILNKGQVSTGIDRLCKKKMLLEYENSKDRRYLQYEIQPLGLQVVLQIIEETKKIYTIITDSISEEKLQTCYETSKMICDNIDKFYKE